MWIKEYFTAGLQIDRTKLVGLALFYFTIYNWYYIFYHSLQFIADGGVPGDATEIIFYLSTAVSTLMAPFLLKRVRCSRIISAWSAATPVIALCLIPLPALRPAIVALSGALIGVASWALSIHFTDQTAIQERGRVAGVITASSLSVLPLLYMLADSLLNGLLICTSLGLSTLIGKALKIAERSEVDDEETESRVFPDKHSFSLLVIALFLFYVDNSAFIPIVLDSLFDKYPQYMLTAFVLRMVFVVIGSIVFGASTDWMGRRTVILITFSLIGISITFCGLYPSPTSLLLLSSLNGLCWGSILVIFLLVIWGEVSMIEDRGSGISVGIGLSLYNLAAGTGLLITPLLQISVLEAIVLNSVTIFTSIILTAQVRETLPSEAVDETRMGAYLRRAKRIVRDESGEFEGRKPDSKDEESESD